MTEKIKNLLVPSAFIIAAQIFGAHAYGQVAVVTQLTGAVTVRDARGSIEKEVRVGDVVTKGDSLQTPEKGELQLLFSNGNLLQLSEKTKIRITEYEFDRPAQGDHSIIDVQNGEARFLTRQDYSGERRSAIIKSPHISAMTDPEAKSGGDLFIRVDPDKNRSELVSLEGSFVVGNKLEKRKVNKQEKLTTGQSTRNKTSEELAESRDKPFVLPTDLDADRITAIQSAIVKPTVEEPFKIYKENHPNFGERYKPKAYIHMKNRMDAKKRKK